MWQSNGAHARYLLELVMHYDYLNLLYIMMTLYLYPCVHNFVWVAIYIVARTFACWYICALVLPSHSLSILDHSLCAYGYSEVLVVVTGTMYSVSVGSTAVGRDMVSIQSGGGG